MTGVAGGRVDESRGGAAVLLTVTGRAFVGRVRDVAGRRAVAAVAVSALVGPVSRPHGVAAIVTAGCPAIGLLAVAGMVRIKLGGTAAEGQRHREKGYLSLRHGVVCDLLKPSLSQDYPPEAPKASKVSRV